MILKSNNFDSNKKCTSRVAKIIIGEELEANLIGIRPQYDITMGPSWKVDTLLSALYFLFNLKPGFETYRCVLILLVASTF